MLQYILQQYVSSIRISLRTLDRNSKEMLSSKQISPIFYHANASLSLPMLYAVPLTTPALSYPPSTIKCV